MKHIYLFDILRYLFDRSLGLIVGKNQNARKQRPSAIEQVFDR